jgi:2-oxoisovalerate dehydrogenase E1 component alpha subunit
VERLKHHLIALGQWSDAQQTELEEEQKAAVAEAWKEAVSYGSLTDPPFLDVSLMFEDVFAETPDYLRAQRDKLLAMREDTA